VNVFRADLFDTLTSLAEIYVLRELRYSSEFIELRRQQIQNSVDWHTFDVPRQAELIDDHRESTNTTSPL
jgi:hypothetical protein